jgi:hypothetical protein
LTNEEAAQKAPPVVDSVDKLVERSITLQMFGGRISPIDRMLHMRTYGMKIRIKTKADSTVLWKGDNILVNNIKFSMEQIRVVVHSLYKPARQKLKPQLLLIHKDNALLLLC